MPQISLGLQYRNREFGSAAKTRRIPAVMLANGVVAVPFREWNLQLGVSNIFDRENFVTAAGTGGGAMPGPDRTFFVRLTYQPQ
jgi:outer membrane receptor protein involved in Fe transport